MSFKSVMGTVTNKLNSAKPSNQDEETRSTVVQRTKLAISFVAGVLVTLAVANAVSYYNSFPETDENEPLEEIED